MFSTREWILVLILASLTQGTIWYAAFVNAANGSALNYVSFAGTLVSIILAVLAIGYTYGESVSQKGKGDAIASQISALREVSQGMRVQAESLDDMSKLKTELGEVASRIEAGFRDTQSKMSGVSDGLEAVRNKMDQLNFTRAEPVKESDVDHSTAAKSFMAARTPLMEISVLFVVAYATFEKDDALGLNISNFVRATIAEFEDGQAERERYNSVFTGSTLSVFAVLRGFGLVKSDDNKNLRVEPALLTELHRTTFIRPMGASTLYSQIRESLQRRVLDHFQTDFTERVV